MIILLAIQTGCAGVHPRPDFGDAPYENTPVQRGVIQTARGLLGTPYKYGGTTPAGFDCSGFVNYVYRTAAGLSLPRMTHDLVRSGKPIPAGRLQPADLVYFKIERQKPLHVGIYIGGGKFIHAPSRGGRVNIQNLGQDYWRDRYLGARRVL
jgi:cell wall-associated NlpC family hydrolase